MKKLTNYILISLIVVLPLFSGGAMTAHALVATANPTAYGAVGNDAADDGPAFQRAIDALSPGGTLNISVPLKKYAIATEIIISKPIIVKGTGWSTIIRANSNVMTSVFRVQGDGDGTQFSNFRLEGSKSDTTGTPERGIYFNGADHGLVENVLFSGPVAGTGLNFGVDINGTHSNSTRVISNKFERMVSTSGNGTAVLIEASSFNQVLNNIIDGSEFNNANNAPGSAIFLSAEIGGLGSTDNIIANNIIHDHPQAGIAINSTTYFDFLGNLGACDRNIISGNEIYSSKSVNGGDASSGIVIVGNSSSNKIINNKIHHNGHSYTGGFGIVISGSQKGLSKDGEPKFDEAPNFNEIKSNLIYNNQDDGIRIKGAKNTSIVGNYVHDNGQRIAATFSNVYITSVGGTTLGNNTIVSSNNLSGSQLAYQVGIGSSVPSTSVSGNFYEGGAKGVLNDLGMSSVIGATSSSFNFIADIAFNIPSIALNLPTPIDSTTPAPVYATPYATPAYATPGIYSYQTPYVTPITTPAPYATPNSSTTPYAYPTPNSSGGGGGGGGSAIYLTPASSNPIPVSPTTSLPTSYNLGAFTLKNGSVGEPVKELQRFLNRVLNLGLVVDGKLGPKTIAVIKKWQKDNGLVADGLIGVKTKAKMNASIK